MPDVSKLVLFDVDKTLIKSSKGHKEAFSSAFKQVYSVEAEIDSISYEGMTDQQIIIEVLKNKGFNEADIRPMLQECMSVMSDFFNQAVVKEDIVLMEGVRELLEELDKKGVIIGLVTGNVEQIARSKLKKARIEGFFKVGGFGNDHIDRAELVRVAIRQASKNFNFRNENNVFVVGDTPRDIKAAKEGGTKAIGVTTGIHTKRELEEAGADLVLENLKDNRKILGFLQMFAPGQQRKF